MLSTENSELTEHSIAVPEEFLDRLQKDAKSLDNTYMMLLKERKAMLDVLSGHISLENDPEYLTRDIPDIKISLGKTLPLYTNLKKFL